MGHGQYLLSSWMSSIFEECIIVFQVLGHHVRIPCIFHGILMVKSNESNTSSHFHVERNLFFQSLESEVSLLLSVVPLVLPLSLAFCKVLFRSSLCFLFSIVFFLRSIRLCRSILPKRASTPSGNSASCFCIRCGTVIACCVWSFHLLAGLCFPWYSLLCLCNQLFPFCLMLQQLIEETSESCHVVRLLAHLWWATRAKKNRLSASKWASVWPIGVLWFFGYRFVIVWVIVWNTWLDPEKNTQIKQWFWRNLWETLLFGKS